MIACALPYHLLDLWVLLPSVPAIVAVLPNLWRRRL